MKFNIVARTHPVALNIVSEVIRRFTKNMAMEIPARVIATGNISYIKNFVTMQQPVMDFQHFEDGYRLCLYTLYANDTMKYMHAVIDMVISNNIYIVQIALTPGYPFDDFYYWKQRHETWFEL